MNKLNYNLQRYCTIAFILLVVLKACTAGMKLVVAENEYSKTLAEANAMFEDTPPEEFLAYLDEGHLDNSSVYAELLNELQKECFEDTKEIAFLSAVSSKRFKKDGLDYSVLDILDESLFTAQSTAGYDDCRDIYFSMMQ